MSNPSTAIAFLKSIDSHSVDLSILAPSFRHVLGPKFINLPGTHVSTAEELVGMVKLLKGVMVEFGMQLNPPKEIIEGKDSVMLRVDCDGKLASGEPYLGNYVFTFKFDSDGKITHCEETVDSAYLNDLLAQDWVQKVLMGGAPEEKK